MEPQKDKDDVKIESGLAWAEKAPATVSNDTESTAEAAEKVDTSAAPTSDEPATTGGATANAAASEAVTEDVSPKAEDPAVTATEPEASPPTNTPTPDTPPESSPQAAAPAAEANPEAAAPVAEANPETAPEATTEATVAAADSPSEAPVETSAPVDQGTSDEPSDSPQTAPEDSAKTSDDAASTEPVGETAPSSTDDTASPATPSETADAAAVSEATQTDTATPDTAAPDTAAPDAAQETDVVDSPPSSPPPLDTVREGIVGKDFKKDDTQRVKIQKPEDAPKDPGKELETKDEGPSKNRNSGKRRVPSRSAAQDAVVGAVVFIDDYAVGSLGETPPSPFTKVGGVSLLRRAVLTAREAGLTTLHCLTKPDLRDLATQEVTVKGVEAVFVNSLEEAPFPDEGRVIYIDARALHDVESLKRLQKWRGARVALLCTKLGDGIRVQIEGVRVREIGTDLVPFDACTGGAISIPMELMPRILDEGYQKMLRDMVDEELLGASFTASTTAREVRRESEVDDVRSSLLSNMGLNTDGFMDTLIHRRISNHLTRSIYTIDWINPSAITALACLFGLLAGPLFALAGSVPIAALFAALSLWLSVILDSVDGELARLKQQESQSGRLFDRCSKALVQLSVVSGLISWFGYDNFMVLIPGVAFALGQIIGALVSYTQPLRLTEGHQISWGDRLDGLILNQNYFYLSCPLFIVAAFLERSQGAMIVGGILALSALLIHLSWIGLKIVGTKNRLPN